MSTSVLLQITNIKWDLSSPNWNDLPTELELEWDNAKWKNSKVSKFISNYYNAKVNSLKIRQIVNKTSSG